MAQKSEFEINIAQVRMDKSVIEDKFNRTTAENKARHDEISKLKQSASDTAAAENKFRTERDQLQANIEDTNRINTLAEEKSLRQIRSIEEQIARASADNERLRQEKAESARIAQEMPKEKIL